MTSKIHIGYQKFGSTTSSFRYFFYGRDPEARLCKSDIVLKDKEILTNFREKTIYQCHDKEINRSNAHELFHISKAEFVELLVSNHNQLFQAFEFCKGKNTVIIEIEITRYSQQVHVDIDYSGGRTLIPENMCTGHHIYVKVPKEQSEKVRKSLLDRKIHTDLDCIKWMENYDKRKKGTFRALLARIAELETCDDVGIPYKMECYKNEIEDQSKKLDFILDAKRIYSYQENEEEHAKKDKGNRTMKSGDLFKKMIKLNDKIKKSEVNQLLSDIQQNWLEIMKNDKLLDDKKWKDIIANLYKKKKSSDNPPNPNVPERTTDITPTSSKRTSVTTLISNSGSDQPSRCNSCRTPMICPNCEQQKPDTTKHNKGVIDDREENPTKTSSPIPQLRIIQRDSECGNDNHKPIHNISYATPHKTAHEFKPSSDSAICTSTLQSPKEFTIIFLGESGVGKSTLISGLGNYLNWPTFEETKKNQMEICIPVEFKVQRKLEEGGFDETTVRAGNFEDNENFNDVGQSVTQKPKVHEFTFQNNTVKIIDTPGLSDTRGAEQDKKNLELIRECIHNQKEIHAICIVLKSNESKLGNQFELAIRDLLSLFPKSALKNVFFFFTYARGTYFGIGDILNPLKELQQKFRDSHGVTFEFEGRNMCPVDSESFRYLLCKEQGIKYSSSAEERFEYCWNETAKQVLDFLAFLKSVDPVDVEKIKAAHELVRTALELEEFLRTDKTLRNGLSEGARELLKKIADPLFYIARSLTMVPEYYRLKTEKVEFDSTSVVKSMYELLPVVKNSSVYDGLSKFAENLWLLQRNYDGTSLSQLNPVRVQERHKMKSLHTERKTIPPVPILSVKPKPPIKTLEMKNSTSVHTKNAKPLFYHPSLPLPLPPHACNPSLLISDKLRPVRIVKLPSLEPYPPLITPDWDNIITEYTEHETIPLIIVPSPPTVTEEWNKIITVYTEHETTPLIIVPPSPPQEFTVIFLGESGVGKSTLISGLGNYLNWPTFEEAKKNQMEICIPVEFKVQRKLEEGGFDETTVRAGDFEDNENFNDVGQSVTQKPKVHEFTFQSNKIKVIDTPGLSDTRGVEQDKKNLELIRECIHNQKEIHAICIVLKSNESKLGNQFELAIRDLLSLFPKSALENIFFFFTYAGETFFGISETVELVKELQKKIEDSYRATFALEGKNTCAVDSESFKFLLCEERGVKYSNVSEKAFGYCWNETATQVRNFLKFIKSVESVKQKTILNVHKLKSSFSQVLIPKSLEWDDEIVMSPGIDKLRFMIMRYSLVFPPYHPLVKDVTEEDFITSLDGMISIIRKHKPEAVEKMLELKEVIRYFEDEEKLKFEIQEKGIRF